MSDMLVNMSVSEPIDWSSPRHMLYGFPFWGSWQINTGQRHTLWGLFLAKEPLACQAPIAVTRWVSWLGSKGSGQLPWTCILPQGHCSTVVFLLSLCFWSQVFLFEDMFPQAAHWKSCLCLLNAAFSKPSPAWVSCPWQNKGNTSLELSWGSLKDPSTVYNCPTIPLCPTVQEVTCLPLVTTIVFCFKALV